jgi:p21-activated kinase 1
VLVIDDGLRHLHDLGIVHGNLNSGNIVLDTQCCVKLVDFGISAKIVREQLEQGEIADIPYWTAPEVITDDQCSPAMDIWALGIISIEIVEGHPPYFDMNPRAARQLIAARSTPTLKDPTAFPWELIKFLSSCLVGNILKRATVSELCLHKFLAKPSLTMVLIPLLNIEMQRVF